MRRKIYSILKFIWRCSLPEGKIAKKKNYLQPMVQFRSMFCFLLHFHTVYLQWAYIFFPLFDTDLDLVGFLHLLWYDVGL